MNLFASCGGNQIKIYDFSTKELFSELKGHLKTITNIQYLVYIKNEYISSSSKDGNLIIWNFVNREKLMVLKNNAPILFTLYLDDYNPSTFVTITKDNKLSIWQQKKNKVV